MELLTYAVSRLQEVGLLAPDPAPEITQPRTGAREISYCTVWQSGRALHLKMGRDTTERIFAREVDAIARVPAAVRPALLAAFGPMGDMSGPWFIVQPLYQPAYFANGGPFAQWTLALAAADTAAALWSDGRLHLDLNSTIFFLEAQTPRLVLLDFNDVVPWPPADLDEHAPVFYDGHHPDLAPAGPHPTTLGEVAARLRGREDRLLTHACAHLLARAAGLSSTSAGVDPGAEAALALRFAVPGEALATVAAALHADPAARPSFDQLRSALARGAEQLARGIAPADELRAACLTYLSQRSSHDGGVA
jgi:hypothetical protein